MSLVVAAWPNGTMSSVRCSPCRTPDYWVAGAGDLGAGPTSTVEARWDHACETIVGSRRWVAIACPGETARPHYSPERVEAWAANYGDLDSWAAARAAAHTQLATIDGRVAGSPTWMTTAISTCCSWIPISAGRGSRRRLLASVVALARQRGLPALTTLPA